MTLCALKRSAPRLGALLLPLSVLAFSACSDRSPLAPEIQTRDEPASRLLDCVADVRASTVTCGVPAASGASRAVIGGQNVYVKLTSSDVSYDAATGAFRFNVTVKNLLGVTAGTVRQSMGTADGVAADANGVRVFFKSHPTATDGTGTIRVVTADSAALTSAEKQPLYRYPGMLKSDSTTAPLGWELNVPSTVNTFAFTLLVSTALEPRVVISEIMANPAAVDDSVGEYIEVVNVGLDPVNLRNWRIASRAGSATESVTIGSDVQIARGARVVLAARSNPLRNGGVNAAFEWGGTAIQLSNTTSTTAPDYVAMRLPAAVGTAPAADSVQWAVLGSNIAPPNGRTREFLDLNADNTIMTSDAWNTGYLRYGPGDGTGEFDRGTPGAANAPLVASGPVVAVRISPGFAVVDTLRQFRRFSAIAEDTLGQASSTTISWSSTNPAVATIDQSGLVTQVDTGRTLIVATASNGVADSTLYSVFTYSAAALYRNHVEFGVPTPGGGNDDILILRDRRTQLALSYNASRGGPNWVSWNLNRTHFGKASRAPTFYTDPLLPAYGVYQVTTGDYTNSGLTRGHMTQSEQRTQTRADNDTTFVMTNILPQTNDLNTGPWQDLEDYSNELARFSRKEMYNIAGGLYAATPATLKDEGKVAIPTSTWKILVVLPYGKGLADVTSAADLQIIVVNMPNVDGIQGNRWTMYTTTVDALEAATGFDFLSALPDAIEAEVEARASATTID